MKLCKIAILSLPFLLFLFLASPVHANGDWVEISYCQNIENNTWYRLVADIDFQNATSYNHVCLAKHLGGVIGAVVGYDTTNITIDMNGHTYLANTSYSSSPFVYWQGAGLRLMNGLINNTFNTGYSLEFGPTISATVENITSINGYYGIIFNGDGNSSLGVLNSTFLNNTFDLDIVGIGTDQLFSCGDTWDTKTTNSLELSEDPCVWTPATTTTTTLPSYLDEAAESLGESIAAGVSFVSIAIGEGFGVGEEGGRFLLWLVISSGATIFIMCVPLLINPNNKPLAWQFGIIIFVVMFCLGTALNMVPILATVFLVLISAFIIGKFGADIFAGGGG